MISRPFVRTIEDGEDRPDTFTIRLNKEERALLEKLKDALHESKDGTAMKQAALVAAPKVIFDPLTRSLMDLAVNNFRRGRRRGDVREGDV